MLVVYLIGGKQFCLGCRRWKLWKTNWQTAATWRHHSGPTWNDWKITTLYTWLATRIIPFPIYQNKVIKLGRCSSMALPHGVCCGSRWKCPWSHWQSQGAGGQQLGEVESKWAVAAIYHCWLMISSGIILCMYIYSYLLCFICLLIYWFIYWFIVFYLLIYWFIYSFI